MSAISVQPTWGVDVSDSYRNDERVSVACLAVEMGVDESTVRGWETLDRSPTANSMLANRYRHPLGVKERFMRAYSGPDFTINRADAIATDIAHGITRESADVGAEYAGVIRSAAIAEADGVWTVAEAVAFCRDVAGVIRRLNHLAWLAMKRSARSIRAGTYQGRRA